MPPVERFLEKVGSGSSSRARGSRGSSPARSPVHFESSGRKDLFDDNMQGFKVHIKQEEIKILVDCTEIAWNRSGKVCILSACLNEIILFFQAPIFH